MSMTQKEFVENSVYYSIRKMEQHIINPFIEDFPKKMKQNIIQRNKYSEMCDVYIDYFQNVIFFYKGVISRMKQIKYTMTGRSKNDLRELIAACEINISDLKILKKEITK